MAPVRSAQGWTLHPPSRELATRYRTAGHWNDQSLGVLLDDRLRANADLELRIWSESRPQRTTIGAVRDLALRVAGGLRAAGVGPDDVVAFQLPNWVEAAATFYGVSLLGAVLVPIVHFYGPKEVRFILAQCGAKALVTAAAFRRNDYLAGLAEYRATLPALRTVVVVDGTPPAGALSFAELTSAASLAGPEAVDPDAPAVVAYTSGTTADPKGVIHSHRTIVGEARQLATVQVARARPLLVGAPVGHGIGMLSGLLVPLMNGRAIHLIDVWDPGRVLAAMVEADVSSGSGSTFFLTSLLDAPGFGPEHQRRMTTVGLGGSPVPAAVAERAEALGISIVRSYGSTEHPSTTGATHDEPRLKRNTTDGRPLPGVEIRLVDEQGQDVPAGTPGEILSRGPDRFVGYVDASLTPEVLDADGWYRTGDIGVLDADGWLTITDRKKDIIIRGGENVSAAEVEELLVRLPGVAEVAVVAAPDPRMGERVCAVFRMQDDRAAPALEAIRQHLDAAGLSRQKWPEQIERVDDFPRTPSGKIKKVVLRADLRARGA